MKAGDIVLIRLQQTSAGPPKLRPALFLADLRGLYQNILICGISIQLHLLEPQWDELIEPPDPDFSQSGLHRASSIRLSYLHAAERSEISGHIGSIDASRLVRLRTRLAKALT
jgi:mRNA interferase MazF